ncbi:MAG: HIT domain-containing protein [Nitrosopumilaceae archaeon]|nr:HIT family protein [Nitrosopumilaceae archaeon]NIU00620.1 HIT family protein [Nitrosopumilaceae archaeon]NIU87006.1 HIT domain-containing protein [Nitrosopumilaceae archaeon]NIV66470.1 HIT domain-containing protein [Nitrosopumilaceae archaeon]NIX61222.1 HIT domain-containing protein [Nitrosopumilaceae archaeon]
MDCIFCKIASKDIPANLIKETEKSIAFLDTFPLTKGHSLVIPKNHHAKIQEISDAENQDLFSLVKDVVSKVDRITGATLVAIHNGKESGQEIPHVHVHLIPRSQNDSAGPVHNMFTERPTLNKDEINELLKSLRD